MYKKIEKIKNLPSDPVLANRVLLDKILEILSAVIAHSTDFAYKQKRSEKEVDKLGSWIKLLFLLFFISLFKTEIINYLNDGIQIVKRISIDSYFQIFYVVPITAAISLLFQKAMRSISRRFKR